MSSILSEGKSYSAFLDHRGVLGIHLNRPGVRNAFDEHLIEELNAFLEKIKEDSKIRLLVLSGEGKHFCAGADLNWMKKMKSFSRQENYQDSMALAKLFENFNEFPTPVLAKCQGAAMGGGAGLLAVCDFVMTSGQSFFAFSEVKLGLIPAVISPYVMAKIGQSWARAYFLSGMVFGVDEALSMGLIHSVVPQGHSLDESFEKAVENFLKAGPRAARQAKYLISQVSKASFSPSSCSSLQEVTCGLIAEQRISQEAQEGMEALLEKRSPHWLKSKEQGQP